MLSRFKNRTSHNRKTHRKNGTSRIVDFCLLAEQGEPDCQRPPKQSIRFVRTVTGSDAQLIREPMGADRQGEAKASALFRFGETGMADTGLVFGDVIFRGFEIPDRIVLKGGANSIHTHHLVGGKSVLGTDLPICTATSRRWAGVRRSV